VRFHDDCPLVCPATAETAHTPPYGEGNSEGAARLSQLGSPTDTAHVSTSEHANPVLDAGLQLLQSGDAAVSRTGARLIAIEVLAALQRMHGPRWAHTCSDFSATAAVKQASHNDTFATPREPATDSACGVRALPLTDSADNRSNGDVTCKPL
jgi:hypothetical protein